MRKRFVAQNSSNCRNPTVSALFRSRCTRKGNTPTSESHVVPRRLQSLHGSLRNEKCQRDCDEPYTCKLFVWSGWRKTDLVRLRSQLLPKKLARRQETNLLGKETF